MAWLTGWSYRKKLTVDHSKVDSDCSDFPVKVIFDVGNFDFAKALSTGNDIRFTSSDGETLLKYERELHRTASTPTGYANATYETSFNGSDEYYSLPSAANLHKPYQVLEVEFTANAVDKDQNIVFLEMANRTGATQGFYYVKERSIRLGITSEGKLIGYMECSNTGTLAAAYVKSSASLSADTKYSAKLVIDNNTKSFALYLDGQLQGRNTVTHAQTWSDISAYIWCDLGILFDYHSTAATNHSRYFDGTIHSYNLMAQNTPTSAVYHVKLPTASSTSDTEFYCYYGKSDASDGADGENVWDGNYAMVHHMGSSLLDSTSNDNDGTNSGTTLTLARDGYYRTFDGVDDRIYGSFNGDWSSIKVATIEGFLVLATKATNTHRLARINTAFTLGVEYRGKIGGYISDGTWYGSWNWGNTLSMATLYHLAGVYDGSNINAIVNGADGGSYSKAIASFSSSTDFEIGGDSDNLHSLKGNVYEVRISSTARSDAWIKATHASLADTLLTYGAEEALTPTARPRVMVVWA
jgi:hypothetical protein